MPSSKIPAARGHQRFGTVNFDWAVLVLMHRPDMQENAHGTGLKAGIQLGCLGPIWVGWMDWMGWMDLSQLGDVG